MEFSRGFNRERCFLSIHYFNSATWGNFIIPFCCFSCLAGSNYSRSSLSYLPETRSGKESVAQLNAWPLLTIGRLFVIRVGPLLDRAQTPTALIIGRVGTNKTITGLEPLDFQADVNRRSSIIDDWLRIESEIESRRERKEKKFRRIWKWKWSGKAWSRNYEAGPRIDIDRRNRSTDSDFPNVERGSLLVNGRFQCTRKHLQEMHPDSLAVVKHSGHKS